MTTPPRQVLQSFLRSLVSGLSRVVSGEGRHFLSPALPWRLATGGLWDEIGRLQLEFLIGQGLRPEHWLLDVGSGALRGGLRFVAYLDDGRYHGLDAQAWLLEAGAGR